jgi:hypothetical protein
MIERAVIPNEVRIPQTVMDYAMKAVFGRLRVRGPSPFGFMLARCLRASAVLAGQRSLP